MSHRRLFTVICFTIVSLHVSKLRKAFVYWFVAPKLTRHNFLESDNKLIETNFALRCERKLFQ